MLAHCFLVILATLFIKMFTFIVISLTYKICITYQYFIDCLTEKTMKISLKFTMIYLTLLLLAAATNPVKSKTSLFNEVIQGKTCEADSCDSSSWCKQVNDTRHECLCQPGYYSPSILSSKSASDTPICEEGLLFAGKLIFTPNENCTDPNREMVESFLNDVYENTNGFINLTAADSISNDVEWGYQLIYEEDSNPNKSVIEQHMENYLTDNDVCGNESGQCELSGADPLTCAIEVAETIENAGIPNEKVCSSIEGYCDVDSATCKNIDGLATCQCLEGYVNPNNEERFCIVLVDCETNPCKDPKSWCKEVDVLDECVCKPGFYSTESSTCEPGLLFAGILVLDNSERQVIEPDRSQLEDFLKGAYSGDKGYISVVLNGQDFVNEKSNYELIYESTSGANRISISRWFSDYLESEKQCDNTTDLCEIELGNGDYFLLNVPQSVANSGNDSPTVCSTIEGYCDSESTECLNVNGLATCNCLKGYVQKKGAETFCSKIICAEKKDCNAPFGSCETKANENVGECKCMFGFEGNHCHSPWLFVFIIVGGVLTLSTLILIAILATRPSSKAVKKTSQESNWSSYKGGMRAKVPQNYLRNPAFEDDNSCSKRKEME